MSEDTNVQEFDDNFDLDADYKPVPLIPAGIYNGNIIGARIDEGMGAIVIDAQLQGNDDQTCSDAETPVDGQSVSLRIWLPKAEDSEKMTPKGNMTKKQWKINNMKDCFNKLGIEALTMSDIKAQIEDGSWIQDGVNVDVELNTYKGDVSNQAKSIYL